MAQDTEAGAVSSPPRTRQRLLPSSSLQAPPLPTLPFDLVVEILCRLPVKLLLQLRCECKSWNSLISDPKFAKKHLRCSPADSTRHHLALPLNYSLRDFNFKPYPLPSVFNAAVPAPPTHREFSLNNPSRINFVIDSCDGIIMSLSLDGTVISWNPSTRRFKQLPSLENATPAIYSTSFGFGYDNFSDSYKVVAVFCYSCDTEGYRSYRYNDVFRRTQVKVHTLGTHSWREIQEFPSCVPFNTSGRFVSGALNWLVSDESNWFIVSLDLSNECYKKLLPPSSSGRSVIKILGVLRDCLCILSLSSKVYNVWLMKEYGNQESWTKLFTVPKQLFPYNSGLQVLHISEDDELLVTQNTKLFVYNARDNTLRTPQIQNDTYWNPLDPVIYLESLVSPCF